MNRIISILTIMMIFSWSAGAQSPSNLTTCKNWLPSTSQPTFDKENPILIKDWAVEDVDSLHLVIDCLKSENQQRLPLLEGLLTYCEGTQLLLSDDYEAAQTTYQRAGTFFEKTGHRVAALYCQQKITLTHSYLEHFRLAQKRSRQDLIDYNTLEPDDTKKLEYLIEDWSYATEDYLLDSLETFEPIEAFIDQEVELIRSQLSKPKVKAKFDMEVLYLKEYLSGETNNLLPITMRFSHDLLDLSTQYKDTFYMLESIGQLSNLYELIEIDSMSEKYKNLERSLMQGKPKANLALIDYAVMLDNCDACEAADSIYQTARQLFPKDSNSVEFFYLLNVYAQYLKKEKRLPEREAILLEIFNHEHQQSFKSNSIIDAFLCLAEINSQREQYPKAAELVHKALVYNEDNPNPKHELFAYQILLDLNKKQMRYDSALFYAEKLLYMDSVREEKSEKLGMMQLFMKNELQQKEKINRITQQRQKEGLLFSLGAIAFLTILSIVLFRVYRQNRQNAVKLQEANQKLRQTNQQLERFASSISHDILSKLNFMLSASNLLVKDQNDTKGLSEYWKQSVKGARNLKSYCEKLLKSTYLTLNQHTREVDPNLLLAQVLDLNKEAIKEKGIRVCVEKLPKISLQESPTLQVFQNLVDNAIRHCPGDHEGKIAIINKSHPVHHLIGVKDNGTGIPQNKRLLIFESGVSLDKTGTGLGLYLVKTLMEEQGGRVWVENNDWGGATFWISIRKSNIEDLK